jgi:hypothetical protein
MPAQPISESVLLETIRITEECGGNREEAARRMGIPSSTLKHRLSNAQRRGISSTREQVETLHGWNPKHDMTHVVPAPLIIRGTSTLYKDGKPSIQWVKTKLDDRLRDEAMRAAAVELSRNVARVEPSPAPADIAKTLCNLFTLTDYHVGMRAWAPETGDDWDLTIAERLLISSMDYLIEASPQAEIGIISQLGDWLHFDSLNPVTPLHGNLLDADSRYSKVVSVATRLLRYAVDKALTRHKRVIVVISEGNHDLASSVWLRHLFSLVYENEPRVEVVNNQMPYYALVHGVNMLAFHHGHLRKNDQLPLLFAAQFPKEWGSTTKRYCHTGHRHHEEIKEHSGMKVIQHSTLAGRDAHAARGGWISDRQITAITYHAQYGQAATITAVPEMFNED